MNESRTSQVLMVFAFVLVVAAAGRMCIGSSSIGWPTGEQAGFIIQERATFLLLAVIVGVALSTGGVALQALLRNPLAEPFILGLSTGAAAGVMAQRWIAHQSGVVFGPGYAGAAIGALASMLVVYFASRRRGLLDPLGLLLTGVVLSTINGALILACNYMAGPGGVRDDLINWMMGYLNTALGFWPTFLTGGVTVAGLLVLLRFGPAMDVATLSESEAQSLGIDLRRMRIVLFTVSSLLAAGAVVLAGPVAFVGLICPHIARTLLGPAHRPLLIGAALVGATLVILADTAGAAFAIWRNVGVMPIGIFTALVGGPVFLWMLHPNLGRGLE